MQILICAAALYISAGCGVKHRQAPQIPDTAYRQAIADAQKAGFTVKLPVQTMPPDSENAATVYSDLTAHLRLYPLTKSDSEAEKYSGLPDTEAVQIARIRSLVKRRSDIIRFAHQAASRPKCVFSRKRDFPDPAGIDFHLFGSIRRALRLLSLESLIMAHNGKGVAAVRNQTLCFRLAEHAGSVGTLPSLLEKIGCDCKTLHGLQNIMLESHGDAQVAKAVRQAINDSWRQPELGPALRQETTNQIAIVDWSRRIGPGPSLKTVNGKIVTFTRKISDDEAKQWHSTMNANGIYILEQMRKITEVADLPYPEAYAREEAIIDERNRRNPPESRHPIHTIDDVMKWPEKANYMYAADLLPGDTDLLDRKTLDIAYANVCSTTASIFEYKAAHGDFPITLTDIKSATSIDPFDLKPLRYRREGKGFVVYSVGPTLKYDGGKPGQELSRDEAAFRYEP